VRNPDPALTLISTFNQLYEKPETWPERDVAPVLTLFLTCKKI
jgi:hypothetical protein